ncbi:MAG: T9SS type A sorting domain-containing protein, partial [Bacteroidetes bacterium]|nr:T9SS type A sorting domain-containing protein [Bacteroidota bacterium]
PGDKEEFDFVYTWARDYNETTPRGSIGKLGILVDTIRNSFIRNRLPNGNTFYGINEQARQAEIILKVYPNPASNQFSLLLSSDPMPNTTATIINSQGLPVINPRLLTNKMNSYDVSGLSPGLYFIQVQSDKGFATVKLLIIR